MEEKLVGDVVMVCMELYGDCINDMFWVGMVKNVFFVFFLDL